MSQPQRSFASDNNSGAAPEILAAIAAANQGHAVGYGDDAWTRRAEALFKEEFGPESAAFFVFNGTGANVLALSLACRPGSAALCAHDAHIAVDEAGAPEAAGIKTLPLPATDGKIGPESLLEALESGHDFHRSRPACVSISQPTELGAVYTLAEVATLAEISHRAGLPLHMDGARLANAAVALGLPFRAFTAEAGVDLLSFGGTKNGLLFGEALVVLDQAFARDLAGLRKTRLQLASKMRFIAAQYEAYLGQGLWKRHAENANLMARRLADLVSGIEGVRLSKRVETNALFATMPARAAEELRKSYFFYDWEGGLVRWMTSFDTSLEDLEGFTAALRSALQAGGGHD